VKFDAPDIESSFGSTSGGGATREESPIISKEPPLFARPVSVAQDQPLAAHLNRSPGEQQRPQNLSILRRSISGPVHTAARSLPPGDPLAEVLSGSHEPSREATSHPVAPTAQRKPQATPPCRLALPELRQPAAATLSN
jgi:hypothetical protein